METKSEIKEYSVILSRGRDIAKEGIITEMCNSLDDMFNAFLWNDPKYEEAMNQLENQDMELEELLDKEDEIECQIKKDLSFPLLDKNIGGFTPDELCFFFSLYKDDKLAAWISEGAEGALDDLIIRFMNFRELNRKSMRKRYPNTFLKWSQQDDEDLRTIYVRQDPDNVDWNELSTMFGRPVNSIKIRLEHLGFTLKEPASRRF